MNLKAKFKKYTLQFKNPSGTSRGVLKTKDTYFIYIEDGEKSVVGEAALFKGLSVDDVPNYEGKLTNVCENINDYACNYHQTLIDYPSIVFGLEQCFLKLQNGDDICFKTDFNLGKLGIPINGLIWMGDEAFMQKQIEAKLAENFKCIKMKIGAINFESEFKILQNLRAKFSKEVLEIRVDANGAFSPKEVLKKLDRLATLDLHSIEQPIKANQIIEMAQLCKVTPLPIALDEELIGVKTTDEREKLLSTIQPQYIILKPALVGGFQACREWITIAESYNVGWWITSALESNIGLDAIAQYTAFKNTQMYQGLGTGKLFTNNISSKLYIENASLWKK